MTAGEDLAVLPEWLALALALASGVFSYVLVSRTGLSLIVDRRLRLVLKRVGGPVNPGRAADGADSLMAVLGGFVAALGRLMPLAQKDRHKISVNLRRAGYHSSNAAPTVLGFKFACLATGLVLGVATVGTSVPGILGVLAGVVTGLLCGVLLNVLPEFVLTRLANRRLRRITAGITDALDLLVVCLESGHTFERALGRTVENLRSFHPSLAGELAQASLDMTVHGRTREEALHRLADRVELKDLHDLATTTAQSERHGTPLADALRKLAGSLRVQTVSAIQQKTARLPILLIIPSVTLILPGILVIVGGPAMLQLTRSLGGLGG